MWQRIKNFYHFFIALLANIWYGFPARKLTVIGITGTDGKTTTTSMIYHILKSSGKRVSMITSVGAIIGEEKSDIGFHVTTPSPFALQKFIKKVSLVSDYLVLEVTSHAIDQHRIFGISFDIAVLTNVTTEHLDYHKTYEKYVATKAKLLEIAKSAIVNADDKSYKILKSKIKNQKSNVLTYGMGIDKDVNPSVFPFTSTLQGHFNRYNALAAIAVCRELGFPKNAIRSALATFVLPIGRMEVIHENNFTVMIDFAHTPNALDQILSTVRAQIKGKLIHVFGSAGERDKMKRPEMGNISAQYADIIILTSEDSRSESVEKIIAEIASGIPDYASRKESNKFFEIADRKIAIKKAVELAKKGDMVIITGKGHEKSMNLGNGEVPWSEYEAVEEALKSIGYLGLNGRLQKKHDTQ